MPLRPRILTPGLRAQQGVPRRPNITSLRRVRNVPERLRPNMLLYTRVDVGIADVVNPAPDNPLILVAAEELILPALQDRPLQFLLQNVRPRMQAVARVTRGPRPFVYSGYFDIDARDTTRAALEALNSRDFTNIMQEVIVENVAAAVVLHQHDAQQPDDGGNDA